MLVYVFILAQQSYEGYKLCITVGQCELKYGQVSAAVA